MTRKDYIRAANLISKLYVDVVEDITRVQGVEKTEEILLQPVGYWAGKALVCENQFVAFFRESSGNFDEDRFRDACRKAVLPHG